MNHPPLSTIIPDAGIYAKLDAFTYHNLWAAASNSRLTRLQKSPAHLKAYLDEPPQSTQALRLGSAIHCAILEPDNFDRTFVVADMCQATKGDGARCTNGGSILDRRMGWVCGIHGKKADPIDDGRIALKPDERATYLAVRDAVYRHPAARALVLSAQETELSMAWTDADTGTACKARLDALAPHVDEGVILDIKSTRDASKREFERAVFAHGYHRQGAFYLGGAKANGLQAKHYILIAVEKEPPYAVAVYRLAEGAIDGGREQLRPLLETYSECVRTQQWPGYSDLVQDISLPKWAWAQIDEETLQGVE